MDNAILAVAWLAASMFSMYQGWQGASLSTYLAAIMLTIVAVIHSFRKGNKHNG